MESQHAKASKPRPESAATTTRGGWRSGLATHLLAGPHATSKAAVRAGATLALTQPAESPGPRTALWAAHSISDVHPYEVPTSRSRRSISSCG